MKYSYFFEECRQRQSKKGLGEMVETERKSRVLCSQQTTARLQSQELRSSPKTVCIQKEHITKPTVLGQLKGLV